MKSKAPIFVMVVLLSAVVSGGIYKWIDPEGNVHYSEAPPETGEATEIEVKPSPTYVEPLKKSTPKPIPDNVAEDKSRKGSAKRSLSYRELGPLPDNKTSKYLETLFCGFFFDAEELSAKYSLRLKARTGLPFGAVLDIQFENPMDSANPITLTKRRRGGESEIMVLSPPFSGLMCGNYQVRVSIYRTSQKRRLIGEHTQIVQSRLNISKARTKSEFADAIFKGSCP